MIETERLIMRPIEEKDFYDICAYGCDKEVCKFMTYWPKSEKEIQEFIEKCITSMDAKNPVWHEYVIQLKTNNKVIGNISLITENNKTQIGWISNKEYWNNGYMSEAAKAFIHYSFYHLGIDTIFATCSDKNVASCLVMEKCQMQFVDSELKHKLTEDGTKETNYILKFRISRY